MASSAVAVEAGGGWIVGVGADAGVVMARRSTLDVTELTVIVVVVGIAAGVRMQEGALHL